MPGLTRRTVVLLDHDRHERLAKHAHASGASVAELIRRAIDRAYPAAPPDRARAARQFLRAAQTSPIPVGDWEDEKRSIRDEMAGLDDRDS